MSSADDGGPDDFCASERPIELVTPLDWTPSAAAAQLILKVLIVIRRRLADGDGGRSG